MTQIHPEFPAFLEYANCFCDMLRLHFRGKPLVLFPSSALNRAVGDVVFFTQKNDNGICLDTILSPSCIPSTKVISDAIENLRASLVHFDRSNVLKNLNVLGHTVINQMNSQVRVWYDPQSVSATKIASQLVGLNYEKVIPVFSEESFKAMVLSTVILFSSVPAR
jgi:hypothetical protein